MSVLNSAVSQSTNSSWFSRGSHESRSASGRSQNYWKLFRKEILAPHHIRILPNVAGEQLPESILTWIEANRGNTARFEQQKKKFRKQVANGRGFGSSALFPQEVLPSDDGRPFLSRCMVPTLSADALPERMIKNAGNAISKSSLSIPRPGLGCGFSKAAFAAEEVSAMPDFLLATGTTVDFGTGSISSGTALYCPYLSYERVFSQQDYGIEIAANQCAIDGAWSVRALQMLYAKANGEESDGDDNFSSPVSFTCAIDNALAVINYHWVDHAQTYCMAPVVRFDLSKDEHFDQFLIWTEAIGQWALSHLLPEVKKAITLLSDYLAALPALKTALTKLDSKLNKDQDGLVSALKLSYDNIPWRYDHDDISPVSSSTASWGSPMINEAVFSKLQQNMIPRTVFRHGPRSVCSDTNVAKGVRFTGFPTETAAISMPKPTNLTTLPPLPAVPKPLCVQPFDENSDLVIGKRMSHAMEEIHDLQTQLVHLKQELSGSTTCIQSELLGLRKAMSCVIRKEKAVKQARSPLRANAPALIQTEQTLSIKKGVSVVTTPTDPCARPSPFHSPKSGMRKPSGLSQVLTVDTNVESISVTSNTVHSAMDVSPVCDTASPIFFSPTIINVNNGPLDGLASTNLVRVPYSQPNIWSQVAATHLLSAVVPATLLRVLFLGAILDYCMIAMSRNQTPTVSQYFAHLLQTAVY